MVTGKATSVSNRKPGLSVLCRKPSHASLLTRLHGLLRFLVRFVLYGKALLRQLRNVRLEEEVRQDSLEAILIMSMGAYAAQQKKRPIIFIGHSLGGLIIKQVGPQILDCLDVLLT